MNLPIRRSRNSFIIILALITACIFVVPASAAIAQKNHYKFQYNPPSGTTYTITCKTTKVLDNGIADKRVDVSTSKEKVTIIKTDGGYSVTFKTLSVELTRNGVKIPSSQNPGLQALMQVVLTYKLDADGKLISIDGIEELQQAIDNMLKGNDQASNDRLAEVRESIKKGVVDSTTAEWNNRIVDFIGKSADSGDVWTSQETVETLFGNANVTMKTFIGNPIVIDRRNCVKIGFSYTADKKSISQLISKVIDMITKVAETGSQTPKVVNASITGKGHRFVDPSTMLISSEEFNRIMKITVSVPGSGDMVITSNETKVYSFDYSNK